MAGKNITLTKNARIKGQLFKAGEKTQVSKEIEQELIDADAIVIKENNEKEDS